MGPYLSSDSFRKILEKLLDKGCRIVHTVPMSITFFIEGQPENAQELNVSNTNGYALLNRLGIEADYSGAVDADTMLGASLLALAVNENDDGVADTVDTGLKGATMIYCGLRVGYWEEKLSVMADIATMAKELNRRVVWC